MEVDSMSQKISTSEISKHAKPDDCWVVVNGKVYDLTNFAPNHPGGANSKSGHVSCRH